MALAGAALNADSPVNPLEATSEALGMLDDTQTKLRAKVLTLHARASAGMGRDDEALRWATEARGLTERLGMPRALADVNTTLAKLEHKGGDPLEAQRSFEKIVAQARADSDLPAELRGLYLLGNLHFEAGQLDEAAAVFEGAVERATLAGRPWAPFGFDARVMAAVTTYITGDWASTLRLTEASGLPTPPLPEATLNAVAVAVQAGRGEATGRDLLETVRPWWNKDGMIALTSGAGAIDLLGDAGDLDGALTLHDDLVEVVSSIWQNEKFQARIRLSALALGQIASHAAQASTQQREELAGRAEHLTAAGRRVFAHVQKRQRPFGPEGRAWVARLEAEDARVRWLTGVHPPGEDELRQTWSVRRGRVRGVRPRLGAGSHPGPARSRPARSG